ncbi:MAG: hypothetical protein QOF60_203 [Actinomycetota bacterium]|jgi:hypothetical protein|nr:hypothetical protein [Actinomycetota bacterium]
MPDPFTSAWLKWGWAVVHAERLEADIHSAATGPNAESVVLAFGEHDPKRHGFPVVVASLRAWPAAWGLQLGDVANNYRSALDHAAFVVAGRGKAPLSPKAEKGVYFPIAGTRDQFNVIVAHRFPGARVADIARFRRYQPYLSGTRKAPFHAFAILADLCNHDKHRAVQPVAPWVTNSGYHVTHARDCVPSPPRRRVGVAKELHLGAEVGFVRVRLTGPQPELEVQSDLIVQPAVK